MASGNLKLEVTNYSRELYGPGEVTHPGRGGDDDDNDGGFGGNSQLVTKEEAAPLITCNSRHIGI